MSDEGNVKRKGIDIAIVVAIIGLLGTIIAAVIGNSDKLFGARKDGASPVATYPADMSPLELHTNRNGNDFSPYPEHTEGPVACAHLCSSTPACKAMTYVLSPNGLPTGDCWLKKTISSATAKEDMTSAVKMR